MAYGDVHKISGRVDVEENSDSITVWHKDVRDRYDAQIDITLDAEENLLEVLLARRNARLAAELAKVKI